MANIGFLMLSERGHLNPTFKLARELRSRGHRVSYLAIPHVRDYVLSQGVDFIPIFEEEPEAEQKDEQRREEGRRAKGLKLFLRRRRENNLRLFLDRLLGGEVEEILRRESFDLLVVDSLVPFFALLAYKVGVPCISLSVTMPRAKDALVPPLSAEIIPEPTLASRLKISLAWHKHLLKTRLVYTLMGIDMAAEVRKLAAVCRYPSEKVRVKSFFVPSLSLPELILCPQEFDFRRADAGEYLYVSPNIDLERQDGDFPWQRIDPARPLVFCTLGSQSHQYRQSHRFFQAVIEAFRRRDDWQLVLAIGEHLRADDFPELPENVILVNWAPHAELLRRASLMINHAGFGTVKDCIYFGVPMVVFPIGKDHPGNAARVRHKGLGEVGNIKKVSAEEVTRLVEKVLGDSSYKERTERMSRIFREAEESNRAVEIIESMLVARSNGEHILSGEKAP